MPRFHFIQNKMRETAKNISNIMNTHFILKIIGEKNFLKTARSSVIFHQLPICVNLFALLNLLFSNSKLLNKQYKVSQKHIQQFVYFFALLHFFS